MIRKTASGIMLALLAVGTLALAFNVKPVKASGTITIKDDGSIDPPTAPISTADNVTYILTGNIASDADGIAIERNNITIDGAGYTLQGPGNIGSHGIYSQGTSGITIRNTNFMDFDSSIEFDSTSYAFITGNNITLSLDYGISFFKSSKGNISGNNIKNSGYKGIDLFMSSFNMVSANNMTANTFGVGLTYSSYDVVSENNIAASGVGCGVELMVSSYDVVSKNKIDSIELFTSTFNTISNNILNDVGLYYLSDSNTVCGNNITHAGPGVRIASSTNNEVFHNNFIKGIPHVYSDGSLNFWDDGYPSGGNYWSDYTGVDGRSGPYQNLTGSDGIGDTPYVIDSNNMDHYPLMHHWVGTHINDVAVANITSDRMWIYKGLSVNFTFTVLVLNEGNSTESMNITLYYNITACEAIGTQNAILFPGQNGTFVFVWDTQDVPYCQNYTITAVVTYTPTDKYPADATLTAGPITVRILGDINGDGQVDGKDLTLVASSFASYGPDYLYPGSPPSPKWNLDADINGDNKIDGKDLTLIARHFGLSGSP